MSWKPTKHRLQRTGLAKLREQEAWLEGQIAVTRLEHLRTSALLTKWAMELSEIKKTIVERTIGKVKTV